MGLMNRLRKPTPASAPSSDRPEDTDLFIEWEGEDILVEVEDGETDDEAIERTLAELNGDDTEAPAEM